MHKLLLIALALMSSILVHSQAKYGYQQYSYLGAGQQAIPMPIAHYLSPGKWYTEARYNYDEVNTFSLNAGRTFSSGDKINYSITPMIGAMAGYMFGGSVSLITDINYGRFNFSSQSQYSFSASHHAGNNFFSWAESSYQPLSWLYAGFSVQHTLERYQPGSWQPGLVLGFVHREWTFPVYTFSSDKGGRYLVLGIIYEFKPASRGPALTYK